MKKHIQHIFGFFRLFLLGSFLLMAPAILAQSSNDTIPTVEEGVIVEEPPPPEVMMDEEEKDDEEKKSTEHFTPLEEKDSLVLYKRRLATGYADKLKKDDDFWYADASIKKEKEKEEARIKPDLEYVPFMQRTWVQTLLWIIIIGGFAYAIMWYLMDSQVGLFRKKNVPVKDMHGAVEEMPEDIFAIQFQQEIDKALAQGNYRLAVRVHFLRLLRNLSDKNLIQYKQEKTNLDYLMELSSKTWYAEFFRLTRHFEYSWYGHFEVEEPTYRIIASEFNQFEKEIVSLKKTNLYIILIFVAIALIALVITGSGRKKKLDERLSFRKNDKIPYGTWVAYRSLSGMFPSATIVTNRREPGLWEEISADSSNQLFMAIIPRFMPEEYEMQQLIRFVENGNDVFISTREISDAAATILKCTIQDEDIPYYFESNTMVTRKDDSLSVSLGQPYFSNSKRFAYPGRKYDATFSRVNNETVFKLGYDGEGELNFVQFQAGKGHLYLHLAPLAFGNYFLLHRQNMEYYEQVMSLIPPDVKKIVWDEYFMYKRNQEQERNKKSWLKVLSKYPGLKAALITAFLTLLLYLLLEMRRKQRIIPVVAKPKNDSLDFVKTIGRLYYDKSDHKNLCRKMGTYFLEYVRNRYKLPTGNLDETFIQQLQFKTGAAEKEIRGIVSFIKYVEDSPAVTAADVSAFHQQLESFYKNA